MQFPGPGVQMARLELAGLEQLAQPMLCIRVPLPRLVLLLVQGSEGFAARMRSGLLIPDAPLCSSPVPLRREKFTAQKVQCFVDRDITVRNELGHR